MLNHGLSTLCQRIIDLVDLDLKLYQKYTSLLPNKRYAEKASAYAGWCWVPPFDSTLEMLSRDRLEGLLWQDVDVYGEVAKSVRMWKTEIDRSIGEGNGV